jgi:hypothetical protein
MVVHSCNASTQEDEAGVSWVWDAISKIKGEGGALQPFFYSNQPDKVYFVV